MPTEKEIRLADHVDLTAGVLVIGGGLAGAWAALSAAQHGADVILVDKGYCGTSGVTATAGVGHWYLPPEARAAEVAARTSAGGDLTEPDWMYRTMEVAWQRLPELDPYYPWPVRDGRPNRATSVRGPEYMRVMRARVRRAGVTILDHHPATELLLHGDGSVAGASGIRLQQGGTWACRASAVILATGGTAFLSRLLGANNNTADGHLMAAEAGAGFSGMEFSCFYTVAAAHSTMTRAFPFMYGTYRDCDGNELPFKSFQIGLPMIARALVRGPVTVVLDQMPLRTRERLAHVQPNFLLPLLRKGIDPFKDQFPVTLRGEGTIRGTGGIALAGPECQVGVEGLYAAGDVASREPIVGAASTSDAGPHALTAGDIEAIRGTVSRELNDIDKNMLRTGDGLHRSLAVLDDLWTQLVSQGTGAADRDGLRAREAAALVAAGRWVLNSAIAREESRGMHHRIDAPDRDPWFTRRVITSGLTTVLTTLAPAAQHQAAEHQAGKPLAGERVAS